MLSADLIARYTSEVDIDWREALVFYHEVAGYKYIVNHTSNVWALYNGEETEFRAAPFSLVLPTRDSSGKQEMSIQLSNITGEPQAYLEEAMADGTKPIQCYFSVLILGDLNPQIDPWIQFSLIDISVTEQLVMATASRADILNRKFPYILYRTDRFPGLTRH